MFINIRPKLIAPIPWGWTNKIDEATGTPIVIEHPGKVDMPNLIEYYDWDYWEAGFPERHWGSIRGCGTRDNKSVFTTALRFLGWQGYADAVDLGRVFAPIASSMLKWNTQLLSMARGAIKYFMVGDDYASNGGMMISPSSWCTHIMPILDGMFSIARAFNCTTIMHTDGDITKILDDITKLPIDILNCEAVGDMAKYKDGDVVNGVRIWVESQKDFVYRGYRPLKAIETKDSRKAIERLAASQI